MQLAKRLLTEAMHVLCSSVLGLLLAATVVWSTCPCKDASLCEPVKRIPDKEVFMFMESNGPEVWPLYDWDKITTISFAGSHPDHYLEQLMSLCHQHSVRLVPLVGLGPVGTTANLPNATLRHKYVTSFTAYAKKYHLDGINFDLESPIYENQTSIRDGYTALVMEMRLGLLKDNPYTQVSVDVSCAPNMPPRYYDYTALGLVSDFLFIMDYDEGYASPVTANSNFISNKIGVEWFIQIGVPANKLVMGLPWYGYAWECKRVKGNFCYPPKYSHHPHHGHKSLLHSESTTLRYTGHPVPSRCYKLIAPILAKQPDSRKWNLITKSPFFFFKDSAGKVRQMQYDDPESLTVKTAYAVTKNLRGVGVWIMECLDWSNTAEAANQRAQFWDTIPSYQ